MRRGNLLLLIGLLLSAMTANAGTTVENIRIWAENDKTRVVLDLSSPVQHNIFTLRAPDRLVVDLKSGQLSKKLQKMPDGVGSVRSIRSARQQNGKLRVVLDLNTAIRSRSFTVKPNSQYGNRLVIDLHREGAPTAVKRASERYRSGRDIVVAIDPGHGGRDPGALGRGKTREKDIVLAISKRLADKINREPGMRAVLIRDRDVYVEHRNRMGIARKNRADLFISVHADAVNDPRARGASVYALSLKGASDEAAAQLAKRENARIGDVKLQDKEAGLAQVLFSLSQNAALSASLDVGQAVIDELGTVTRTHRSKVQQAGFLVLKSPDMPSILIETAFISNPDEERKLRSSAHQDRLSNAILNGVRNYFYRNPPPDTQIAMKLRQGPVRQVKHRIARGDTLSEIAERYNVSQATIRSANRLNGDRIRVGQTLKIPVVAGS
ncbi:MAG: N-acetylmuramoyl-L-alanine amidase [Woeseiaceae bacterium]|nr:N-acetylmuramoyl-L-alanine amidase [Woeseiaceae bacterium]